MDINPNFICFQNYIMEKMTLQTLKEEQDEQGTEPKGQRQLSHNSGKTSKSCGETIYLSQHGCHSKISQTGWLKQLTFISHCAGGRRSSLDRGASMTEFWQEPSS